VWLSSFRLLFLLVDLVVFLISGDLSAACHILRDHDYFIFLVISRMNIGIVKILVSTFEVIGEASAWNISIFLVSVRS